MRTAAVLLLAAALSHGAEGFAGRWDLAVGKSGGPNPCTVDGFRDVRLEFDFNCPRGYKSGIFLRGGYEPQIEEDNDFLGRTGSI